MKRETLRLYGLALLTLWACSSCNSDKAAAYQLVEGKALDTYYKVSYDDSLHRNFQHAIDSLLGAVHMEISTALPNSTISRINQADSLFELELSFTDWAACVASPAACGRVKNAHFQANFQAAKVANQRTGFAFDPTSMPLARYWAAKGSTHRPVEKADSLHVDSLLQLVGLQKVELLDHWGKAVLKKARPGVQLDFGSTGQGYCADAVSNYLELQGIQNYWVDIDGKCRARGKNPEGQGWTIDIGTPGKTAGATEKSTVVFLGNGSASTVGDYRQYQEADGQKYRDFVNPRTGYPEKSRLLSTTVIGKDCLMPTALANGFLGMAPEKAIDLASHLDGIQALFIFSDEHGELQVKYTAGLEKLLVKEQ